MDQTFRTTDLEQLLLQAHPDSEWALLFEVAPRTGGGTRYADAVAVNLWKSRGYAVHGFELKASRSDWLRELKQPEKPEQVLEYCDHFWVVASPGIVMHDELPPGWGLMEPTAKRGSKQLSLEEPAAAVDGLNDLAQRFTLKATVKAGKLKPKPISREFFASLMRRGAEGMARAAQRQGMQEQMRRAEESRAHIEQEVARRTSRMTQLEDHMKAFEQATGLKVSPWGGPPVEVIQLAQRLHKLSGLGRSEFLGHLDRLCDQLDRNSALLRETLTEARGHLGLPTASEQERGGLEIL